MEQYCFHNPRSSMKAARETVDYKTKNEIYKDSIKILSEKQKDIAKQSRYYKSTKKVNVTDY